MYLRKLYSYYWKYIEQSKNVDWFSIKPPYKYLIDNTLYHSTTDKMYRAENVTKIAESNSSGIIAFVKNNCVYFQHSYLSSPVELVKGNIIDIAFTRYCIYVLIENSHKKDNIRENSQKKGNLYGYLLINREPFIIAKNVEKIAYTDNELVYQTSDEIIVRRDVPNEKSRERTLPYLNVRQFICGPECIVLLSNDLIVMYGKLGLTKVLKNIEYTMPDVHAIHIINSHLIAVNNHGDAIHIGQNCDVDSSHEYNIDIILKDLPLKWSPACHHDLPPLTKKYIEFVAGILTQYKKYVPRFVRYQIIALIV